MKDRTVLTRSGGLDTSAAVGRTATASGSAVVEVAVAVLPGRPAPVVAA